MKKIAADASDIRDLIEAANKVSKNDVKGTQKDLIKVKGGLPVVFAKDGQFLTIATNDGSIKIPVKSIQAFIDEAMKYLPGGGESE